MQEKYAAECGRWQGTYRWPAMALLAAGLALSPTLHAQETLFEQDFEDGDGGITLSNGTNVNAWVVGEAVGNPGRSLYISQDGGVNWDYAEDPGQVSHAWYDIEIGADFPSLELSFDWRGTPETGWDFVRVWLVPTTFTPVVGTEIVASGVAPQGRVQLGEALNTAEAWTAASHILSPGYAGTTVRLVFEWKNDDSFSRTTSIAVDNIRLVGDEACLPPWNIGTTSLEAVSATITFAERSGQEYEYELRRHGAIGEPDGFVDADMVSAAPLELNGLEPRTRYTLYMRSVCGAAFSDWTPGYVFTTPQVLLTDFPWEQDFEDGNDLYLDASTTVNGWYFGSAVGNPGSSLYISNSEGATNTYTHTRTATHAWRDLQFPSNDSVINLSFDWHALGESCCDYVRVWLVPLSYIPTPGTGITTTGVAPDGRVQLGTNHNNIERWAPVRYTLPTIYRGQQARLVFEWINDGSLGSAPAGAIDNILLTTGNCPHVTNVVASDVTTTSITYTFDEVDGAEYYYELRTHGRVGEVDGQVRFGVIDANTITIDALNHSTQYAFYVRTLCGGGEESIFTRPVIESTVQNPVTDFPWLEDFSNGSSLTVRNGTSINGWYHGNATGNTAPALYISNDGGFSNAYTVSAGTVVHAWRDFAFNSDTVITLSFDWRSLGEATNDYIRVWVVPMTFLPTQGTQIASMGSAPEGRVQLGGNHLNVSNWQAATYVLPAAYANQQARLIFEWTNNTFTGTNPPGAIDNISIITSNCPAVTAVVFSDVGPEGFTFGFSEVSDATYYYEVRTSGLPGTPGGLVTSGTSSVPSVTVDGLDPTTDYTVHVRTDCGTGESSAWSARARITTTQIPVTVFPWLEDFETGNGFFVQNAASLNRWVRGSAIGNPGSSMYISNDEGVTAGYDNGTTTVVHAWRDLELPPGFNGIDLSFDWIGVAESCCDYIRVWLVPNTFIPTQGTRITATGVAPGGHVQLGGNLNSSADWQSVTYTLSALYAGTSPRVVFEWYNDGSSGTAPGGGVDNVAVNLYQCLTPQTVVLNDIGADYADIGWLDIGSEGYEWEVRNDGQQAGSSNPVDTRISGTNSVRIEDLESNTAYTFYVRSLCDNDELSPWTRAFTFRTGQIPVTVFPWSVDFADGNDGGIAIANGTSVNHWIIGDSTGNPAPSLYISNGNGRNGYTESGASTVVHVWRDFSFPDDMPSINMEFDWKSMGEMDYDFLRVWVVPLSFVPTTGTMITAMGTAPGGRVQLGGNFQQQATWQRMSAVLPTLYAGTTVRIVLEWRNDISDGTQPPVAVDNFLVSVGSCARPDGLALSNVTANSLVLSWNAFAGTSYRYEVRTSGAPGSGTGVGYVTGGTSATSPLEIEGLPAGTALNIYVIADCADGETSTWSEAVSAVTSPDCGSGFYDTGGPNGDYGDDEDWTQVLCPRTSGQLVLLTFTEFNTEDRYDKMFVYNGSGVDPDTKIASTNGAGFGNTNYGEGGWWGSEIPGPFLASNPTGCLTVVFVSDGGDARAGFAATVACVDAVDCVQANNGLDTHCYTNNSTETFTYVANDNASFLTIQFDQGRVLPNDEVRLFNSTWADPAAQVYRGNNLGNMADFVRSFENITSGPRHIMTVQFISNAEGSCATGEVTVPAQWWIGCGDSWVGVERLEEHAFHLFPNPTTGLVNMQFTSGIPAGSLVRVFDMSGRTVLQPRVLHSSGDIITLDLGALETGMYTLQLVVDDRSMVKQVQVMR